MQPFHLQPKTVVINLKNEKPKLYWCLGNQELLHKKKIGISGARNASSQSLLVVKDCVEQAIKQNLVIVSGNANGIDLAAHYTALKNKGETIFVLPEGIEFFRVKQDLLPVWNWTKSLVISQFEPKDTWQVSRAMIRNETIIKLSNAMIIIEAGETGGTFNVGLASLKLKVPIFCVKYKDNPTAKGNEILIAKGAESLGKNALTKNANMSKVFEAIS